MIYLDSAATSLLKPPKVEKAVIEAMSSMVSPGRGGHSASLKAADKVYECRELACKLFNVPDPQQIVFTMNATHGLNIAIRSLADRHTNVVISGYEHNSVTRVLNDIGANVYVAASPLFDREAAIKEYERLIPNSQLVIINHISNVFGFIQPIDEISEICKKHRVPLIIDASQSAGVCDIDFARLNPAFMAMPGHKGLMGPQGTGVLICNHKGFPLICGGTGSDSRSSAMPDYLPDRLEAGTHNVPGIAGLCEGLRFILERGAENIGEYEKELCVLMAEKLQSINGLKVYSDNCKNQGGVLSVIHETVDAEALCSRLDSRGVAARCGLHCAPLAHKTGGTLQVGTVRFSFSPFISKSQVLQACKITEKVLN